MQHDDLRVAVTAALKTRTPEQLAADIGGVTANTLRNFVKGERGIRTPTLRALTAWADRKKPRAAVAVRPQATDPVAAIVASGQAEAAAWVLEFAARLLEAGAQQLRQGARREDIISAVEQVEERATRPKTARRRASEE
jgi:hypothetical protein